jgi:hypothetical protein
MGSVKILFLAANPLDTQQLRLDEEIREISQRIRAADYRDTLDLVSRWAVRPDDVLQAMNEERPSIVHFSGHGSNKGEILLEDADGTAKPISGKAIRHLFSAFSDTVRLVLLNACFAQTQAQVVVEHIDCAIGSKNELVDKAAIVFAASFYRALGFGRSIQEAYDQGVTALLLEDVAEQEFPVLLTRSGIDARDIAFAGERVSQSCPLNIARDEMDIKHFYKDGDTL